MTVPASLHGPEYGPLTGDQPEKLVLLLHGLGADGNDLIGLAPELAEAAPNAVFVSPNAPHRCDMSPMGYQWFSLLDRTPSAILAGVQATAPVLDGYISQQRDRFGLKDADVALLGFSQGTMMSLYVAPRRAEALGGVMGFSGRLIGPELLEAAVRSRPPVLLVHGDADAIVPWQSSEQAETLLANLGFETELLIRPHLPHGIDREGIDAAKAFLRRIWN